MHPDDLAHAHLASRLGADAGAFKQKKTLYVGSAERDRPDPALAPAKIAAWLLRRKRVRIVSVAPPLVGAFKGHLGEAFGDGDFAPAELDWIASELRAFYGDVERVHRRWFTAGDSFEHVQEVEISPLTIGDSEGVEAILPGRWEEIRDAVRAKRAFAHHMDGKAVAISRLRPGPGRGVEIDVATHPDAQGIGFGTELVAHGCRTALDERKVPLFVAPDPVAGAGRIAKKLGLEPFAEDFVFLAT